MKTRLATPSRWLPQFTAASIFGATLLRSLLVFRDTDDIIFSLSILGIWLALLVSEPSFSRQWPFRKYGGYFTIYLVIQTSLICFLLAVLDRCDFFAILFAILSMQVMYRFRPKVGRLCVGLFAPLIVLSMSTSFALSEASALTLIYTGFNIFVAHYSRATQRAQEARAKNQKMVEELESNNRQLQAYSQQLEQLASARERLHLARELHDSVTQTVFSMNLTTQSALVLLERDPGRVEGQLDHLSQLAQSALAEMRTLITELRPEAVPEGGLAAALRQHVASRPLPEGLIITLDIEGDQCLAPAEEQGLFRIVQEAVNNVVKHSHATQAAIRLHLCEPYWIEIEDNGRGFDLQAAQTGSQPGGQLGLSGMRERAAGIGWDLRVLTAPGAGTRIQVSKPQGERQA